MNDQSSIDTRDHVIKDDLITTSVVDTISNEGNDFEGGAVRKMRMKRAMLTTMER